MLIAKNHSMMNTGGGKIVEMNWNYNSLIDEINTTKQTAYRRSGTATLSELNFGLSEQIGIFNPTSLIVIPFKNKDVLGAMVYTVGDTTHQRWVWIYPNENRIEETGLTFNFNTANGNIFVNRRQDGKMIVFDMSVGKVYTFDVDGTNYQEVGTVAKPGGYSTGLNKSNITSDGKYIIGTSDKSTTTAILYDCNNFNTIKTVTSLGSYMVNYIIFPNGEILCNPSTGSSKHLDTDFSTVLKTFTVGSYYAGRFYSFLPIANRICSNFTGHSTSIISYDWGTKTTQTTTVFPAAYENQTVAHLVLPTGEILLWCSAYGYSGTGLNGNGAIIFDPVNDTSEVVIPSDGSTTTRGANFRLLSNGKIFCVYTTLNKWYIMDIGLSTTFSLNMRTSNWFSGVIL